MSRPFRAFADGGFQTQGVALGWYAPSGLIRRQVPSVSSPCSKNFGCGRQSTPSLFVIFGVKKTFLDGVYVK